MLDYANMWEDILRNIKNRVNETTFTTWFSNIKFINFQDDIFILQVPSEFNKNVISVRHSSELANAIKDVAGENCQYFLIDENEKMDYKKIINSKIKDKENDTIIYSKSKLNPKYTFEEFVIGSNNELAHAAAVSVAKNPGFSYNPLFIYGQVGIGKTHLIQAIAHSVLKENPLSLINYITTESFTNEMVECIKDKKMTEFKAKYRKSDVLIIDDIQFISGKTKTQEEFFYTFDEIRGYNKQIIIASDRPPNELHALEERLRSRFSSGLICDIQAPDYETRVAIIKKKAESMNIDINNEVCSYIATNVKTNIRESEGALIRIGAISKLTNMPISIEMATEALKDIFSGYKQKEINANLIKEVIARYYSVSIKDLESKKRSQNITFPRQICMYIIRELTELPYIDIGREFGGRDHSTVINAYNKIEDEINKKESFKKVIDKLIFEIQGEN